MDDADEVARIRDVYDGYAHDGRSGRRWDPDQPGNRAILDERGRRTDHAIGELMAGRGPVRAVDLGSGDGDALAALPPLLPAGSAALGVDLLEARLVTSVRRHPELAVVAANGAALPFPTATVDVVTAFTVFSSILDAGLAAAMAAEIGRVLAPGGAVVWYDLRRDNPRNRAVRGLPVPAVRALFPGWRVELDPCTVLPPLVRRTVPLFAGSYVLLGRVPPLRTHLFGVLRPQ